MKEDCTPISSENLTRTYIIKKITQQPNITRKIFSNNRPQNTDSASKIRAVCIITDNAVNILVLALLFFFIII